ncbi:MAG TPA: hypothetical protein VKK31_15300 [Thermoanaerobaculia bacterium]|nr:hypothetical protein [Thermoanaerobaculia bacterium]
MNPNSPTAFRHLLDARLFRLLCGPGRTPALDGFRTSLERHRLSPAGGLPAFEVTPLAFLRVLGVEPPRFATFTFPLSVLKDRDSLLITTAVAKMAQDFFAKVPDLQAEKLRKRVEELREKTDSAAHELFDLALSRFAAREGFEGDVHRHLAFDALYQFQFPKELREQIFDFLAASLFAAGETVSGLSKMRIIRTFWYRSYERLLKKHPGKRAELQALDREMRLRSYRDYLNCEVVHHSVLGYVDGERVQPVAAFTPDAEDTVRARCSAYKSALRWFLDQIDPEELATTVRPRLDTTWQPGLIVPCREDGTFDVVVATGDLPVY